MVHRDKKQIASGIFFLLPSHRRLAPPKKEAAGGLSQFLLVLSKVDNIFLLVSGKLTVADTHGNERISKLNMI